MKFLKFTNASFRVIIRWKTINILYKIKTIIHRALSIKEIFLVVLEIVLNEEKDFQRLTSFKNSVT